MLLTLSTTHQPATDLGYLLVKHPQKCQTFDLAYGKAHVFYPEAKSERCTAALLLDFDPVGLVRGRRWGQQAKGTLAHYVNDRPYAATSFLSVAIAQVFASAMKGQCKGRPELSDMALPFEASLSAVPSRGGPALLAQLFEPLGYTVQAEKIPLDEAFPEWGEGSYYRLRLKHQVRLSQLLTHLYVLIPVLDAQKHYWVGDDEVAKLLEKGAGWLADHPMREQIALRYLKHRRGLAKSVLRRLDDGQTEHSPGNQDLEQAVEESNLERPLSLNEQRLGTVLAVLKDAGARRILDLGCGEGRLVGKLLNDSFFTQVTGVDVSASALERATERLRLERMPEKRRQRLRLFQGSLVYRDPRFSDCDAACAIEVIEHIDPSRLAAFERVLFEFARPSLVVITTPNVEHNIRFETLPAGKLRHRDHRFEWTRGEFQDWSQSVASRFGYDVRFLGIGNDDVDVGPPTQMAVFER